jgi:hypothetical protein
MKHLLLVTILVVLAASLTVPTPVSPNPYVVTYKSACRYDLEDNLMNVNGRIVPREDDHGTPVGKSLEASCRYVQAIPQDYTNCVVQVSGNCQMTNGAWFPGSYENIISHACCPPK